MAGHQLWKGPLTDKQALHPQSRVQGQGRLSRYLESCIQESNGDAAFIAKALGDIAWAKLMTQAARAAGLSWESVYKALSDVRSPRFYMILKDMSDLDLRLSASVKEGIIIEDVAEVA